MHLASIHRFPLALAFAALLGACSDSGGDEPEAADDCRGPGVICTYMGNGKAGPGEDGARPRDVRLYLPQDLTFGPDGQPYVLDWNNHRVRTLVDGRVHTVIGNGDVGDAPDGQATGVPLNHPTHVAFDAEGRIILSAWHNSKVMRCDLEAGTLDTITGDGDRSYSGDGGPAKNADLDLPVATVFDRQGRLLLMDQANQRIRRIEEDGTIQTVVGPSAEFLPVPAGYERVCVENAQGVEQCKLCLPSAADEASCPAQKPQGFAGDGGPGTEAVIFQPFSQSAPPAGRMEMGPDGVLYFCDTGNHRIRALDEDGSVRTVAGSGPDQFDRSFEGGYAGDGGPATEALLARPTDVAVDPDGNLYIADTFNGCIRRVDTEGTITTVAGQCGTLGYSGDGGSPTEATLDRPYGVALDADRNLYIADTHNHVIRVVYAAEPQEMP
jgi:DNA-binding beta-propeller fold protein YncE